ncbi:hypothetical protein LPB140_11405 [Sphingorhabdus lutea]|uniref:Spermidine synthase n=1 Tax=Sphingorhabdus lutea TaxID=1913578 RepID=A0A1L3JFB3_9SPHN|nr:hypothetical protein LPB140_11405 [Sphingorhabdus lutea]
MDNFHHLYSGRGLITAIIFLGSFLLFMVQPMVARIALPELGGSSSVWNSAMLVYQCLLLAGYGYAHFLSSKLGRRQYIIHPIIMCIAFALWLPFALYVPHFAVDFSPFWRVPIMFIFSIGPPFFIIAAQAPLMQIWFSRTAPLANPYPLYAASNLGSFFGLLSYPFLIEPFFALSTQKNIWAIGGCLLLLLVCVLAWRTYLHDKISDNKNNAPDRPLKVTEENSPNIITWKKRLLWLALSAIPSAFMLSTTTHISTDIIAMPMLWVLPLALYLLSFTIAFSDRQAMANIIAILAPWMILAAGAIIFYLDSRANYYSLLFSPLLLLILATALHQRLYTLRPDASSLTIFYLWMAAGGALGGIFAALIAPLIFDWTWEHPLLLICGAILLRPMLIFGLPRHDNGAVESSQIVTIIFSFVALALALIFTRPFFGLNGQSQIFLMLVMWVIGIISFGSRPAFIISLAALMIASGADYMFDKSWHGQRVRSYFGIYTIDQSPSGNARWLTHGTTLHGTQLVNRPTLPTSYYNPKSGVGLALAAAPSLYTRPNIAVVGLGSGTLSCYKKPEQKWTFFEIDPVVAKIAQDKRIFSFLHRCAPDANIIIGDARISLGQISDGQYDILVIDAFSSDSIPIHLLTQEAFQLYRRVLRKNGMLIVHISNRYFNLEPVLAAEAQGKKWFTAKNDYSPTDLENSRDGYQSSTWVVMVKDERKLRELELAAQKLPNAASKTSNHNEQWILLNDRNKEAWRDDYSPVLKLLNVGNF